VDEHESEGDCSPSMDMYSRVLKWKPTNLGKLCGNMTL
jgi:hypothetical protein